MKCGPSHHNACDCREAMFSATHAKLERAEGDNERLRTALRLVMACAGDINSATDADLEAALECGDAETEKQANAWLVAREALRPNVEHQGRER